MIGAWSTYDQLTNFRKLVKLYFRWEIWTRKPPSKLEVNHVVRDLYSFDVRKWSLPLKEMKKEMNWTFKKFNSQTAKSQI